MIFAASEGVNLKVIAKNSNTQFQKKNSRYVFNKGDHATAVICLLIALSGKFQVRVRFSVSNGRQKGQAHLI